MDFEFKHLIDLKIKKIINIGGYDNQNYLLVTEREKYILKTYLYTEEIYDLLQEENKLLESIKNNSFIDTPVPIPFNDGKYINTISSNNQKLILRLLSFVKGSFISDINHSENTLTSLGQKTAKLDLLLKPFKSYLYKSRKWEWNIENLSLNKKYINEIPCPEKRRIANYFMLQFEEVVVPNFEKIRKGLIHNDINESNLLGNQDEITGLIDFGDVTFTFLISEIAIAIVYAVYQTEDYINSSLKIIKGYNDIIALENIEIELLYYFIAARLVISVCNSAHTRVTNPDNEHAFTSEEKAWKMLYNWLKINPLHFSNSIKKHLKTNIIELTNVEEALKKRHQHISPILSISYKNPVHTYKAALQYMYDCEGNTFLDAYNNIPHVGHSHPKVVLAGQKQLAQLNTNTRYVYDILSEYAESLLKKFPNTLNKVFFVNSGSEANDLALRMAKIYTKKTNIMVVEHGYHGHTQADIDISDYKFSNPKGQGQKGHILKVPIPDTYRGKYTQNDGTAGKQYANEAIELIKNNREIAAFIAEPIVGCGGQIPLAKGYLKPIYKAIREQGGICISDEVQTGFGRLGDCFWGYESHDVIPDIVVVGKPIGNGHPLAAVICKEEIAQSFEKGVEFFASFGGNPVSCAIGKAVLEVIEDENLQKNALTTGNYYIEQLKTLQKKYPCIGDIRGSGLFLGIDIVKEHSKTPDTFLAQHIKNKMREDLILISTDGPADNVIKTKPPIIFSKNDVDIVIKSLDQILNEYFNKKERL